MPQGYEISHPRFWSNTLLPFVGIGVAIGGVYVCRKKKDSWICALVLGSTAMVLAGVITSKLMFPQSTSGKLGLLLIFLGFIAVCGCVFVLWVMRSNGVGIFSTAGAVTCGVFFGCLFPWTQRGLDAATVPVAEDDWGLFAAESTNERAASTPTVHLTNRLQVIPKNMVAKIELNNDVAVSIHPVLTFDSTSPDRFWTIFSRSGRRVPSPGMSGAFRSTASGTRDSDGLKMLYSGIGDSVLRVVDGGTDGIRLDAMTQLAKPVYSHLNTFCKIEISSRHEGISLLFSPCHERVEAKLSDYPVGAPTRLAFLDSNGAFRVVEASSAEKGPFSTLEEGELKRGEPLGITIFIKDEPVGSINLLDWSAQVSTQLSPTAGWGLPENAIEFSLTSKNNKTCMIYVTLASTSIGRGYDSVGHRSGTYRNRVRIVPSKPASP